MAGTILPFRPRNVSPSLGPAAAASFRRQFERAYNAAQQADLVGDTLTILSHCDAALGILNGRDLYGADQIRIVETIRSRIRAIEHDLGLIP